MSLKIQFRREIDLDPASLAAGEPGLDTRFGDFHVGSTQIHSVYKTYVDVDSTLTIAVGDTLVVYPGFPSPDYFHQL